MNLLVFYLGFEMVFFECRSTRQWKWRWDFRGRLLTFVRNVRSPNFEGYGTCDNIEIFCSCNCTQCRDRTMWSSMYHPRIRCLFPMVSFTFHLWRKKFYKSKFLKWKCWLNFSFWPLGETDEGFKPKLPKNREQFSLNNGKTDFFDHLSSLRRSRKTSVV